MWIAARVICFGILVLLSYLDIRTRKVPAQVLAASAAGAAVYHLQQREMPPALLVGGAMVGLVFLLISRVTDESMGYGDSLAILILGVYLGFWELVQVLAGAFLLLGIAVIFILSRKRMSRKCLVPFFPFLTGGYILTILAKGGML